MGRMRFLLIAISVAFFSINRSVAQAPPAVQDYLPTPNETLYQKSLRRYLYSPYYYGVFGGVNLSFFHTHYYTEQIFLDNQEYGDIKTGIFPGLSVGLLIGRQMMPGLRLELELGNRLLLNKFNPRTDDVAQKEKSFYGRINALSLLGNIYIELPLMQKWFPYAKIIVGPSMTSFSIKKSAYAFRGGGINAPGVPLFIDALNKTKVELAYGVGGGIVFPNTQDRHSRFSMEFNFLNLGHYTFKTDLAAGTDNEVRFNPRSLEVVFKYEKFFF